MDIKNGLGIMAIVIAGGLLLFVACCTFAAVQISIEQWWHRRQLAQLEKMNAGR